MSYYLNSKIFSDSFSLANEDAVVPLTGESGPNGVASDHAIDSALRSVPLPDGLMTRLSKLVYSMPDESADQVDWLSC